jgi:hypothetical protein
LPTCGRTGCGSEFSRELEDAPAAARKCSLSAGRASASSCTGIDHEMWPEPITLASDMPFTTGTADQPVRPPPSARVHHRSLRTVTSLVTSHRARRPSPASPARTPALRRAKGAAFTEATPGRASRPLAIAVTQAREPARPYPNPGEPLTGLQSLASSRRPATPDAVQAPRSPRAVHAGSARAHTRRTV